MELSANAGNRTGDRTFKQDPRGRLHYSHGSSSTSTLSPHPAILACRCQFVPLLPSVFVSDAFYLSPSFSIPASESSSFPERRIRLPNYWRQQQGRSPLSTFFLLLRTIFFSLTTLVILPLPTAIHAWLMELLRSNPLDRYFPIRFQRWIGLGHGKANRGCHPGRTSCHLPLHYRCKLLEWDPCPPRSPIGFVPLMLRDQPSLFACHC